MKWLVLSMSVISPCARRSARAAAIPPNPPPMITTRGRAGRAGSGKSILERSGSEGHEKHQKYQQDTVGRCGSERQCAKLRQNLHRDRTIGVRVQNDARHELSDRG